ncbi:MAG: NADH-quinone oxidoreductase subunit J [Thermoguttaceae bacterium]
MNPQNVIPIATVLLAAGLWLMLPRGTARGRGAGLVLAAAGLGLWVSRLPGLGDWLADGLFHVFAGVTVISAIGAVTFRNPVYCAIWFGMTLTGTSCLFLLTGAEFLAVATLVIYAGAILVTFLFVLMLAQPEGHSSYDRVSWEPMVSAATGAVLLGVLTMTISAGLARVDRPADEEALSNGVLAGAHVARFGTELFSRHLVAVEVAATLLFAALVGAAVIVAQARAGEQRSR